MSWTRRLLVIAAFALMIAGVLLMVLVENEIFLVLSVAGFALVLAAVPSLPREEAEAETETAPGMPATPSGNVGPATPIAATPELEATREHRPTEPTEAAASEPQPVGIEPVGAEPVGFQADADPQEEPVAREAEIEAEPEVERFPEPVVSAEPGTPPGPAPVEPLDAEEPVGAEEPSVVEEPIVARAATEPEPAEPVPVEPVPVEPEPLEPEPVIAVAAAPGTDAADDALEAPPPPPAPVTAQASTGPPRHVAQPSPRNGRAARTLRDPRVVAAGSAAAGAALWIWRRSRR